MSLNDEPDPGMAGLEAALAALAPLPGRLNRDALLFRAGQASARRRPWLWPTATMMMGLVAAGLGVVVLMRPAPPVVERVIVVKVKEPAPPDAVPAPASPEPTPSPALAAIPAPMNYAQLEKQVLRWGLDGVPSAPAPVPPSDPPLTRDSLFQAPSSPLAALFNLSSFFP